MIDLSHLRSSEIDGFPGYLILESGQVLSNRPVINSFSSTKLTQWVLYKGTQYKLMKPQLDSKGYPSVSLVGKRKTIHSLLAKGFLVKGEGDVIVRHLDDNKLNNSLDNLAYGRHSDNYADAVRNGRKMGFRKII
jgi:HNH endonuclease